MLVLPVAAAVASGPPGKRDVVFFGDWNAKKKQWRDLSVLEVLEHMELRTQLDGISSWWAHNGGRFDYLFLAHVALGAGWGLTGHSAAGRLVYMCLTSPRGVKLHFFDSQALVPAALKKAAQDWCLPTQKLLGDDDYSKDPRTWHPERMRAGVEADALAVLELVEAVETQAEEWEGKLSATFSGTAFSVLRGMYGRELPDMRRETALNLVTRLAYTGGRVEVLRHHPRGRVFCYDVNSSYPWSMTQELPNAPRSELGERELKRQKWRALCGVVEARVTVPDQHLGPLPWVHPEGGLYFPTGTWMGWFHPVELANAADHHGVTVRAQKALTFEPIRFSRFVEKLYALKRTSQGAVREFAKLCLNGGYGKLGQHPERETLRGFSSELACDAFIADLPVEMLGKVRQISPQVVAEPVLRWSRNTNYATAGAITANSRVKILEALRLAGSDACYTDTDSVHTTARLPGQLLDETALGLFKLERMCVRARYYAPKLYALHLSKPEKGKLFKAKGFPVQRGEFEAVVAGELVARERMQLLKGQARSGRPPLRLLEEKRWLGFSNKRAHEGGGLTRPWTVDELQRGEHQGVGGLSPLRPKSLARHKKTR